MKPDIVCAHLSAYGRQGERKHWPGYDYLMQAEAGLMAMTGEPDTPPTRFGMSMIDYMGGTMMALGLVSAVLGAKRTGRGCDVDVSLFDAALHQLSYSATWFLNEGKCAERLERSPTLRWRPASCRTGWLALRDVPVAKVLGGVLQGGGRPDLLDNPPYADMAARRANRAKLQDELDAFLSTRSTAEWMTVLGGVTPVGRSIQWLVRSPRPRRGT
ncbi:MAG: CoA transferase [Oceanicaulis sp.]|nr:CoA transferase [Oceanicaulis sp.]